MKNFTLQIRFFPLFFVALTAISVLAPNSPALAQIEETEAAPNSFVAGIELPYNARRVPEKDVAAEVRDSVTKLATAAGPNFKAGKFELLAWTGANYSLAKSSTFMDAVRRKLQMSGWEIGSDKGDGYTVLTAIQEKPTPRMIVGLWVPAPEALLLGWTQVVPVEETVEENSVRPTQAAATNNSAANGAAAIVHSVDASQKVLNVMKGATPKLPAFQTLAPKAGTVRGWVKDMNGKPLVGAKLGVRSTMVGGAYSGAQATTDARGYYEIQVPMGVAHFYNAGYTIDWGEGRAALGLHPADGELDSFASAKGHVENFVLLPYGIANRDDAQDQPQYVGNYYGGGVVFSWRVADERPIFASPSELPANSQVEITLTPTAPLLGGAPVAPITIRKQIGTWFGQLYVVNIPATTYKVSAQLIGGGALKMKEVGPYSSRPFGLSPKEGADVTLERRPGSAKADMATSGKGGWDSVAIDLSQ